MNGDIRNNYKNNHLVSMRMEPAQTHVLRIICNVNFIKTSSRFCYVSTQWKIKFNDLDIVGNSLSDVLSDALLKLCTVNRWVWQLQHSKTQSLAWWIFVFIIAEYFYKCLLELFENTKSLKNHILFYYIFSDLSVKG